MRVIGGNTNNSPNTACSGQGSDIGSYALAFGARGGGECLSGLLHRRDIVPEKIKVGVPRSAPPAPFIVRAAVARATSCAPFVRRGDRVRGGRRLSLDHGLQTLRQLELGLLEHASQRAGKRGGVHRDQRLVQQLRKAIQHAHYCEATKRELTNAQNAIYSVIDTPCAVVFVGPAIVILA